MVPAGALTLCAMGGVNNEPPAWRKVWRMQPSSPLKRV